MDTNKIKDSAIWNAITAMTEGIRIMIITNKLNIFMTSIIILDSWLATYLIYVNFINPSYVHLEGYTFN